jgi:hypothetical protein
MVRAKSKTTFDPKKVLRAAKNGSIQSLGHGGAAIRLAARRSIKTSAKESAPGTPPNSRKGQLKRAIVYAVEKEQQRVVIGPDQGVVGTSGAAHEFGGQYKKQRYEKRPFMGPALEKIKDRLPQEWAGSVK